MGKEIERKFLIKNTEAIPLGKPNVMKQGYLPTSNKTVTRIRISGEKSFITIKGENKGATRTEFEYEIPTEDAEQIIYELCEKPIIEKERYKTEYKGKIWELDIFQGDNKGLMLAEIELESENEAIEIPAWISEEVTDDPKYYNSNLAKNPYKNWNKKS